MTDNPSPHNAYHCPTCGQTYRTADAAARGWTCCGQRLPAIPAGPAAQPISPATRLELCEILPGRDSETAGRGAENLFASLGADEPYALEIWSEPHGHHLLVRAPSPVVPFVLGPIRAVYPQAGTRPLPCAAPGDPGYRAPGEALVGVELRLESPAYLPLRTFRDEDYATADPLAGILGRPLALAPGERLLAQLVLRPAPPDWGRAWAHLAQESNPFATAPTLRTLGGNVRAFLVLLLVIGGGAA
ncbi:MAG: hypothetical protein KKA73_04675, partial [Chloroflexi bacterium]|nr:hypothetical protein [Chloroflexota bacterium]